MAGCTMARVTIIFAALLVILGLVGYFGESSAGGQTTQPPTVGSVEPDAVPNVPETKKRSVTALIPTFTGILLLIPGLLALHDTWRMHAMHGAAVVALLGFLAAGGRSAMGLLKLFSSEGDVNLRSLTFVCLMALLCGSFLALCINSFIQARRQRQPAIS